ncbi:HdeD family acid-resistance protein [uncultured Thomasclavelia sp.]|uniref:HdeD family acid-resistance protein n=1 Tax=uncultured Thomasclavelia sp. TaxID=3025759 RepID=UPI0025D6FFAD|nr:DUF308 domain-containing protein [uncultured Thomasclavelia sp.]
MYWDFDFIDEFKSNWNKRIKKFKILYLILGIVMVIAGICCLAFPIQTFTVMKVIVALVLIGFGIYSIVNYCLSTSFFKDPFTIVHGIINILFGLIIITTPSIITAISLTMMLALILVFHGTEKIAFASKLKYFNISNTGIYTFNGILNIILAIIFFILPITSAIALNYIIAIYLIINGITLFIEAVNMKKID